MTATPSARTILVRVNFGTRNRRFGVSGNFIRRPLNPIGLPEPSAFLKLRLCSTLN
jgi:hypothetical protein